MEKEWRYKGDTALKIARLRAEGFSLLEIAPLVGLKTKQAVDYYIPKKAGVCRVCQRAFAKPKNEKRLQPAAGVSGEGH